MKIFNLDFNMENGQVFYGYNGSETEAIEFFDRVGRENMIELFEGIYNNLVKERSRNAELEKFVKELDLVKRVILEFKDGETFVFNSGIEAELFTRFYTSSSCSGAEDDLVDLAFKKMDYAYGLIKFTEFMTSIEEAIDAVEDYFEGTEDDTRTISNFIRGQFF